MILSSCSKTYFNREVNINLILNRCYLKINISIKTCFTKDWTKYLNFDELTKIINFQRILPKNIGERTINPQIMRNIQFINDKSNKITISNNYTQEYMQMW